METLKWAKNNDPINKKVSNFKEIMMEGIHVGTYSL